MSKVGTLIDKKYELVELLAIGGQAEVYRGVLSGAKKYSKTVAIKRILSQSNIGPEQTKYFEREAELCALLNHPNLVQTFDFVQQGADLYLVMEFIHGRNLQELQERAQKSKTPLSTETILYIVSQACMGLDYAHQKTDDSGNPLHIVHRDISPHNIMITYDGVPKVVDFGVAKAKDDHKKTKTGMFLGKLAYMSPEQVGGRELDARTDIFNMGLVLYELLAGRQAYSSENAMELMQAASTCKIPTFKELGISISEELEQIVFKALARQREDRYVSAIDMAEAIQNYAATLETFNSVDLGFLMKSIFEKEIVKEQSLSRSLKVSRKQSLSNASNQGNTQVDKPKRSHVTPLLVVGLVLSLGAWKFSRRHVGIEKLPLVIKTAPTNSPSLTNVTQSKLSNSVGIESEENKDRKVSSLSEEVIQKRRTSNFEEMLRIAWAQPKSPSINLDPAGSETLEFVIARWSFSPACRIVVSYGDLNHSLKEIPRPCLISTARGCGPFLLTGKSPFRLAVKMMPRTGIDSPNLYLSKEDCNHMGSEAILSSDGTCQFSVPAGKQNIGIHFSTKESQP